jgi:hypothetical protein
MRNVDTGLLRAFVAVAETGGMTAAGMAMLPSTAPHALEVLGSHSGLPAFSVTLHLPKTGGTQIARELARFIRASIVGKRLAA